MASDLGQNRPGQHLNFQPLPKINEDEILAGAKQDAQLGFSHDSTNLPPILQQVKIKLISYKTSIWNQAQNYFTNCQTNITNAEAAHSSEQILTDLSNKSLHSNELNLPKVKASLNRDFHNFEIQRENYYNFKTLHSRTLLPKNADPVETRMQIKFLIGLFVVEAILNMFMLFSAGATTFQASLATSLGQTSYNILTCYFLGKYLIGHIYFAKTNTKKISLISLFIVHIYTILVINANIGIYRNAIVEKSADIFMELEDFITKFAFYPWDKMGNMDVTAGLAFAIGLVFAALAYLDGIKSDELYPGYGAVYRGALKFKSKVDLQVKTLNERWNSTLNAFNSNQSRVSENATKSITNWSMETNAIEQVWSDYKKHINELEEVFDGALQLYVSKYNQYNPDKKITLKQDLLDKDEFDLKEQFDDVEQLHLDDKTRIKIEAEKNEKFAKDFDQIKKDLAAKNKIISQEIDEISKKFRCKLN